MCGGGGGGGGGATSMSIARKVAPVEHTFSPIG